MKESTTSGCLNTKSSILLPRVKVEKEEVPSLIPLQVIDERFSEQPVVQPEAKWCVKQLVIASPTGDELEIKCSNLAVVVELLRKMSM